VRAGSDLRHRRRRVSNFVPRLQKDSPFLQTSRAQHSRLVRTCYIIGLPNSISVSGGRLMFRSGSLLLALLLLPVSVHSQSVDSSFFNGLRYRLVGPARGGRVTTVTGVPSQPRTFYMGVASGGLFRTTDAGANWTPITDGKVPVGSMGSVAVADSDPNIIYLGTGSDGVRSNVSTGRGVYKTTDGGATWSFIGLYNAGQIGAVRIHPTNPNIVWVAANGDVFKSNDERGVFKTTDGG